MITTAKVKEHIALVEAAAVNAQNPMIPSKAAKKETAKWIGVRNSLLQAVHCWIPIQLQTSWSGSTLRM